MFRWLSVIGAYEFEHNRGAGTVRRGSGESAVEKFCRENFVRPKVSNSVTMILCDVTNNIPRPWRKYINFDSKSPILSLRRSQRLKRNLAR